MVLIALCSLDRLVPDARQQGRYGPEGQSMARMSDGIRAVSPFVVGSKMLGILVGIHQMDSYAAMSWFFFEFHAFSA